MRRCVSPLIGCVLINSSVMAQQAPATRRAASKEPVVQTLRIGERAPDFDLPGVDGRRRTLRDFADAKILVVVFTCNHCPTAQAYEERIKQLAADYAPKGVRLVAISPNDPKAVRLDELGYTDLSDSFDEMKVRARHHEFNFPYLYDGDSQAVSRTYGPTATPTVFIFDAQRKLRYVGRIDDNDREKQAKSHDARGAIDALLAGQPVSVEKTRTRGCSIKWSEKRETVVEAMKKLAAEPVAIETIDARAARDLIANKTDKLRLINIWATWCGSCIVEFPELVTINRMYRLRAFEFITISADHADKREAALAFLRKQQASNRNVLLDEDQDAFAEAIDPKWDGSLPYTLLIRPGGQVVYTHAGPIDPLELRRAIVKELSMKE
jgi:peroxiredoxin